MVTLANVMRANAASCLIFGMVFLSIPSEVANFLANDNSAPNLVLQVLGVGLIINGLDLIRVSRHKLPNKYQIWYFSIGDFLWGLISLRLILSKTWITSKEGIIVTLLIGIFVTLFGCLQIIKRKERVC